MGMAPNGGRSLAGTVTRASVNKWAERPKGCREAGFCLGSSAHAFSPWAGQGAWSGLGGGVTSGMHRGVQASLKGKEIDSYMIMGGASLGTEVLVWV